MRDDAREELERIEKELLAQEPEETDVEVDLGTDILDDELIREVLAEPAFEDMDEIKEPDEPMVYCNYSNDYGRDLEEFAESGGELPEKKMDDKINIGLMITASALCLGIIGVMIYWLVKYL